MMAARTPVPTQTMGATKISLPVPQTTIINISHIQDKTPQATVSVKQEPATTTSAAPAWKVAVAVIKEGKTKKPTCSYLPGFGHNRRGE